jgi:predicted 2-oxoglutarate/Fe(II)-dependent dioxygenase YbiX/alkylated DNA repair dioxygenase AlkB
MMTAAVYLEENNYVVLQGALSEARCKELTDYMFNLYNQGKLIKDDQCPKSDAIYGDPAFDEILADFAKPIGDNIDKELIPTYTYARIYRPGEVLKKHKDRPSCEISATITLGYEAKFNWPIYFDENKEVSVTLEPGDLAVYNGCEVCHWRKPFKGKWHVQLFLHYVDANGPYKDHAFDHRPNLGLGADTKVLNNSNEQINHNLDPGTNPIFNAVIIPDRDDDFPGLAVIDQERRPDLMFTKEECDRIVHYFDEAYPAAAAVGGDLDNRVKREVRSADIFSIENTEEHRWIFNKIARIVSIVNENHFRYEIAGITHSLQIIRYDSQEDIPGHYSWHVDSGPGPSATRKISLTVQLSDPYKYKGCNLEIMDHSRDCVASRDQGVVSLFPSYMPHRVTPIEEGERYALVIWVHGSRRFK